MRKLIYVMLGMMLAAGAGFVLVKRQLRLMDDSPTLAEPAAKRSVAGNDDARATEAPAKRSVRRIDRGIEQYRTPQGGWKVFEAVIDVLNVVVGVVGICLALAGMRARRADEGRSRA